MSEFTKIGSESSDSEQSSSSKEKRSTSSSVRSIGAFAKFKAEATPALASRSEALVPDIREILSGDKKEDDAEKTKKSEKTPDAAESETKTKRHHETLKEQIVQNREKNQEIIDSTTPDTPEHAAALQANEFEDRLEQRIENPELDDPIIEAEYRNRMEAIEQAELEEALDEEAAGEPEGMIEMSEGIEPDEIDEGDTDSVSTGQAAARPIPQAAPTAAQAANATPPGPPSSQPMHSAAAGGGSQPPTPPPTTPTGAAPPPQRPPHNPRGTGGSNNGNIPPAALYNRNAAPSTPNILQTPVAGNEQSKKAGAFLVGGILGYMIGRRGGRKRAERRLQPEITTLKNNLEATKQRLMERERSIKEAAATKLREQQIEKYRKPAEKPTERPVREILRQTVVVPEKVAETMQTKVPEHVPATANPKPMEAIPQKPVEAERPKRKVEALSTPELLTTAEALFIEGTSVRTLYETNQIDRRGLVEIVQTALQGGNIAHTFEKVELGRERQYERAREFRHDDPSFSTLSDDDAQQGAAPVTSALPNSPDTSSLQPLTITQQKPAETTHSQLSEEPPVKSQSLRPAAKTAEFKFAAIAALIIAGLIIWAILS